MDPITQMNNVSTINNANAQQPRTVSNEMNGDSFLKLFIESLKNQDPMAPMDQAQMMSQLTQLTMIETVTNMKGAVDKLMAGSTGANPLGDYISLIGKKVKVEEGDTDAEGLVISVGKRGDDLMFELADGRAFNVSSIVGVTSDSEKVVEPEVKPIDPITNETTNTNTGTTI